MTISDSVLRGMPFKWALVCLGLATSLVIGLTVGGGPEAEHPPVVRAEPTGCPPKTLCDEQAAIQAALAVFPEGHNPHGAVARLLTATDAYAWARIGLAEDDPSPEEPAWLVAILGDGLTMRDVSPVPTEEDALQGVAGLWTIWKASGANWGGWGGLDDPTTPFGLTYASVVALQSQNLLVDPPTPILTLTPGPTPTFPTPEWWP